MYGSYCWSVIELFDSSCRKCFDRPGFAVLFEYIILKDEVFLEGDEDVG